MVSYENLLFEVEGRMATITVNRPKVLNALNRATLGELARALGQARERDDIGLVILTGAGDKAFVAGADIAEMAALGPGAAHDYARLGQETFGLIDRLGKPVLAAINGFALGGGCELAMAATLRLAADHAELGQPEVNLGLIPGFAGTQRLPRLIGRGRALELLLTGDRIKAAEAQALGLVNRVVPRAELMAETRQLGEKILSRGPKAVTAVLEAVRHGLEAGFEEGCRLEAGLFGLCFATEDMKEGTAAFLEKRPARFPGR